MADAPRPQRTCASCGQIDDHPRHVIQLNRQTTMFHQDCHAALGCADCAGVLKDSGGAHGDELTAYKLSIAGEG